MSLFSYVPILLCGAAIVSFLHVNRNRLADPKIQSGINLTLGVQVGILFLDRKLSRSVLDTSVWNRSGLKNAVLSCSKHIPYGTQIFSRFQSLIPIVVCGVPVVLGIVWRGPEFKVVSGPVPEPVCRVLLHPALSRMLAGSSAPYHPLRPRPRRRATR